MKKARHVDLKIWENVESPLMLSIKNGQGIPQMRALWRETDGQDLIFLANPSGEEIPARVDISSSTEARGSSDFENG